MKKGIGQISIGRVSSNKEPYSYISIQVVDSKSHTTFLQVAMSLEALGNAITGMSFQPCKFELYGTNVGKTHEHKTVFVPCDTRNIKTDDAKQKVLAPYEVDGWQGRLSDLGNMHRYNTTPTTGFTVTFERYVDDAKGK